MKPLLARMAHPGYGALALTTLTVALSAAGCGSSSSGSSSGAGPTNAAATIHTATGGSASKKHVSIGVILTETSVPSFVVMGQGASAAGTIDGNAKVVVQGPAVATGTAEATMAENLQQSLQPDGFATTPCVLPAWTQTLASLERNVPNGNVLAMDCAQFATATQQSPVKTYVGPAAVQIGETAARTAIQAGGLKPSTMGTALVAECVKGVPTLDQQLTGLTDAVKQLLPKVKIVSFVTAEPQTGNTAAWTSALNNNPRTVFAIGACDQDGASLATLKSRHVGGPFVAGETEANSGTEVKAILDGFISGGTSVSPWVIGYVSAKLLIDTARGAHLPQGWVDTGTYPVTKRTAAGWLGALASPSAAQAFFLPTASHILQNAPALTKSFAASFAP